MAPRQTEELADAVKQQEAPHAEESRGFPHRSPSPGAENRKTETCGSNHIRHPCDLFMAQKD